MPASRQNEDSQGVNEASEEKHSDVEASLKQ